MTAQQRKRYVEFLRQWAAYWRRREHERGHDLGERNEARELADILDKAIKEQSR